MVINSLFSFLIFTAYDSDFILSLAFIINVFIAFFVLYKNSPDNYILKLSLIYLMGFSLFIGGRFFSNLFGASDIYCFDFGYYYCLNSVEKIKSIFLINFSLIFFVIGFLYKRKTNYYEKNIEYINNKVVFLIIIISLICGFFTLYSKIQAISLTLSSGYMALYEGQDEVYATPFSLLVSTLFTATLALIYSLRNNIKTTYYFLLISLFILIQLLGVLTGARAGFLVGIIILIWLVLGDKKFNIKKLLYLLPLFMILIFTNYISSLSGARITESNGSFYERIIIEIFYSQGISMMVFNLGVLEGEYPFIAYLKTIFPGIQVLFSFFSNFNNYDLSFSQSLTYKLAPQVYYNDMGWGWSLLGDFYAFSFGFVGLFLFYNLLWGKLIYTISLHSNDSIYYRGLFFCFFVNIFSISRTSISYLIFLIFIYTLLYFSIKIVIGRIK